MTLLRSYFAVGKEWSSGKFVTEELQRRADSALRCARHGFVQFEDKRTRLWIGLRQNLSTIVLRWGSKMSRPVPKNDNPGECALLRDSSGQRLRKGGAWAANGRVAKSSPAQVTISSSVLLRADHSLRRKDSSWAAILPCCACPLEEIEEQ